MSLSVGIVGLPNVGKSTLFQALTKKPVDTSNYPFATIDPNVGVVAVPDERLEKVAAVIGSPKIVPAVIEFIDIAGLVKGASQGEGLGNKFLQHIREVAAIVHVVRAFTDPNVTHVTGKIDPAADQTTVRYELAMADLEQVERGSADAQGRARSGDKNAQKTISILSKIPKYLNDGRAAVEVGLTDEEQLIIKPFNFLTMKPILTVLNVDEGKGGRGGSTEGASEPTAWLAAAETGRAMRGLRSAAQGRPSSRFLEARPVGAGPRGELAICVKLEAELAGLPREEAQAMLKEYRLEESGLDRLIRAAYDVLNLITFFTANENEAHAWTIQRGTKAQQAAGVVHTDFERGFIRAEVINWKTLLEASSWNAARDRGRIRMEGKEYVFQDGDVALFHHT